MTQQGNHDADRSLPPLPSAVMISVERTGPIWTVTLDRPDKANALTRDMLREIETILSEAEQEKARALVLTGTGKVFSAGADIEEARAGLATDPIWERVSSRVARMPCLTIAALNGTLAGGAFGMVLACDIRIADPKANFFYPAIRLGFLPQPSDPRRLSALIGPNRAKMILLAAEKIDAQTAFGWGLISEIVPAADQSERCATLAAAAVEAEPELCRGIKKLIPD